MVFMDSALFASNKGFVNFNSSLFDDSVDDDLIAETEDEKITFFDFRLGDLVLLSISFDGRFLFGDEAKFIDCSFGSDFVNDTD